MECAALLSAGSCSAVIHKSSSDEEESQHGLVWAVQI